MNTRSFITLIGKCCLVFILLGCISACTASENKTGETSTQTAQTPVPGSEIVISIESDNITCEDAYKYYDSGQIELASKAYSAILASNPLSVCALEGSAAMTALLATPDASTVVPTLLTIGDYDGAWNLTKTGVGTNPETVDAFPSLFVTWNIGKNFLAQFIVPILSALLILLILILVTIKICKESSKWHLDMTEFSSGSFALDEKTMGNLGKSIISRIEYVLKRDLNNLENNSKGLINNPINPPELPALNPTQISSAWNFIIKLFPQKVVSIEGLLESNVEKGLGLTVKMICKDDQRIIDLSVFWIRETDQPSLNTNKYGKTDRNIFLFYTLADIAAARIFWVYCLLKRKKTKRIFGTNSFESYKWWFLSNNDTIEDEIKEKYLQQSLLQDYKNSIALVNMGRLYLKQYYQEQNNAVDRERILKNSIRKFLEVKSLCKKNSLPRIQANYNLGCISMEIESLINNDKEKIEISEFFEFLNNENELKKYRNECFKEAFYGAKNTNDKISANLSSALRIPYIQYLVESEQVQGLRELRKIETNFEKKEDSFTDDTSYNLSCLYSLLTPRKKLQGDRQRLITSSKDKNHINQGIIPQFQEKFVSYLEIALKKNPKLANELKSSKIDPCFNNINKKKYHEIVDLYTSSSSSTGS